MTSRAKEIDSFKELYGQSAFVCRYIHCSRASDGFSTARQRDSHEAHHERRYRCAIVTCVYFEMGFVTKSDLKRHNNKYHPNLDGASLPSLAELSTMR